MPRKVVPAPQVPTDLDVAAIRAKLRHHPFVPYTQAEFARALGVSVGTVRHWEQGRRQPTGPARVLLALIDRAPGVVRDTLKHNG